MRSTFAAMVRRSGKRCRRSSTPTLNVVDVPARPVPVRPVVFEQRRRPPQPASRCRRAPTPRVAPPSAAFTSPRPARRPGAWRSWQVLAMICRTSVGVGRTPWCVVLVGLDHEHGRARGERCQLARTPEQLERGRRAIVVTAGEVQRLVRRAQRPNRIRRARRRDGAGPNIVSPPDESDEMLFESQLPDPTEHLARPPAGSSGICVVAPTPITPGMADGDSIVLWMPEST